jgi:transcriptional regulator with XRE-family HTH domain
MGSKIRRLREEHGLTITEISERTGLTISTLSQVERDIITPSISSLRRIAAALNVPAFYFLVEGPDLDSIVVRKAQRKTIQPADFNAVYQLLTPNLSKRLEVILFKLSPGEATCEAPQAHEGEECLIVLSGCMKAVLPDQEVVLQEGDSIYFDRLLPHQLINVCDDVASAVCAISPPSF